MIERGGTDHKKRTKFAHLARATMALVDLGVPFIAA